MSSYTIQNWIGDLETIDQNNVNTASKFTELFAKLKDSQIPLIDAIREYNSIINPTFGLTQNTVEKLSIQHGLDINDLNLGEN